MDRPITDELLMRFLSGKATADERKDVERWMSLSAENRQVLGQLWFVLQVSDRLHVMQTVNTEQRLRELKQRIARRRQQQSFRRALEQVRRVAAILLIPVAAMLVWQLASKPDTASIPTLEMSCNPGMVAQFTLPDSSKVWLNGGSRLSYPATFGTTRRVTVSGQAYFEVARREKQAFVVAAGQGVEVRVLGTKFNVAAFPSEKRIETTLVEGSVELLINNGKQNYGRVLKPGEKSIYLPDSAKVVIANVNTEVETAWKDRRIVFSRSSMDDVIRTLSRYYNAEFVIRGGKSIDASITGSFSNESLAEVMRILKIASGIDYRIERNDSATDGERHPTVVEIWKRKAKL